MDNFSDQTGDNPEALYQSAYELFQLGQYQQALTIALQLAVAEPGDSRFHFLTGMCLQFFGESQAAANFYGYVLLLDPAFTPAAFRLAECLMANGEEKQAKVMFESVIETGRENAEYFTLQSLAQKNWRYCIDRH